MTGKDFNILMSLHRVTLHWMQVFSCSQVSDNCAHTWVGEVHLCQLLWSRWILRRGQLIWICRVVSPDNNNHSALCGVSEAVGGEPARPGGRLQRSGGEKWSECQSRGGSGERESVTCDDVRHWPVTRGSAEDNNIIWWRWSRSRDTDTRGVRPQWWTRGLAEERV